MEIKETENRKTIGKINGTKWRKDHKIDKSLAKINWGIKAEKTQMKEGTSLLTLQK